METSAALRWRCERCASAFVALVATLSTTRVPPFVSNQETYLAHAAARSVEAKLLRLDWFVHTLDPVPVFTWLVVPLLHFGTWATWLGNALFGAILLVAMARIAAHALPEGHATSTAATFGLISVFSLLWALLPGEWHSLLFDGVAGQSAFARFLEPSNAGVLLVAAAGFALAERPWVAVAVGGAAAWIHPIYALSALILAAGSAFAEASSTRRRATWIAGLGIAVVMPPVISSIAQFAPTTAALAALASRILVETRFPYHAVLGHWFGLDAALKLALMMAALMVERGRTRSLLGFWIVATCAGSLAAVVVARPELDLLFPWRATVWLVPVSTALLVGRLASFSLKPHPFWAVGCPIVALAACGYCFFRFVPRRSADETQGIALAQQATQSEREAWELLIPADWEGVRLNAPASVYVDFKSHPYKDTEVVAWWERIARVKAVYEGADEGRCERLRALLATESRIGFVLAPTSATFSNCDLLSVSARNQDGTLYRVAGRTAFTARQIAGF